MAAYDIQTGRCDEYGGDEGFATIGFLVYDGLHYDPLVIQLAPGLPQEADLTVVDVGGDMHVAASEATAEMVGTNPKMDWQGLLLSGRKLLSGSGWA